MFDRRGGVSGFGVQGPGFGLRVEEEKGRTGEAGFAGKVKMGNNWDEGREGTNEGDRDDSAAAFACDGEGSPLHPRTITT